MTRRAQFFRLALIVLLPASLGFSADAQSPPPGAPAGDIPYSRADTQEIAIGQDGLITATFSSRVKILTAAAVQSAGTSRDTNNAHYFDYQVLSAATIKPDGRRVPVDPAKILVEKAPAAPEALHFYVDSYVHTIIFPEVAVGDELETKVRIKQKQEMLPGGVSWGGAFPRFIRRSGAEITIRAPKSAGLRLAQKGLEQKTEESGDEVIHRLTYRERPFAPFQADGLDLYDYEPHYYLSTFKDWNAVAQSFWIRGAGKSDPTPEIEVLARKVTEGKIGERAKAEAVFNWVSTNIRYVNIVLGAGGWVPRDAASILANRYGDCKDHVTLMRAMLRVVGVKADYALVNAASRYTDYQFAHSWFDHIILYLPGLDLYVDPTVTTGQFGAVEPRLAGKPVLRFDSEAAAYTRIPTLKPEQLGVTLTAEIRIAADGTASGTAMTTAHGSAVPFMRSRARAAANGGLEATATKAMNDQQWRGQARYIIEDQESKAETASVKSSFVLKHDFFQGEGRGMRVPTGPRITVRPGIAIFRAVRDGRETPFVCFPTTYQESIDVHLPDGAAFAKPPPNIAASDERGSYRAEYTLEGSVLKVRREFVWKADSGICDAKIIATTRRVLGSMVRDYNTARLHISMAGRMAKGGDGDEPEEAN